MKTIDEDIKNGTFQSCYLLYGEEAYLKKQYKDKLLRAMVSEGDTMNFASYSGKSIHAEELVDLAETLPFFAERRVILVQDSGFFKNSCEILADYLTQIPETACFIFVESEVDRRTKAYKAAKKAGAAVEFCTQKEAVLTRWALGRIGKERKQITKEAMQLFWSGPNGYEQHRPGELEKLLCYTMDREAIEASDVKAIVTERPENQIFEMIDAISARNQKKALGLYYDLLALKEAPMRILYLLTRQLRILSEVKELAAKGCGSPEIASKVSIPEFAVRKNAALARGFSKETLLSALKEGAAAEEAVKTGQMGDKIAVELLIVRCSQNVG